MRNNYQIIFDNLQTGIIVLDECLKLHQINQGAIELLELGSGQQAKFDWFLSQNTGFSNDIQRSLSNNEVIFEHECSIKLLTNEIIVNFRCTPINGSGINDMSLFSEISGKDLDNSKYLIIEVYATSNVKSLRDINLQKHQNASTNIILQHLTHEIRNPLAGLTGAAQLLSRKIKSPKNLEYIDVIVNEVNRLTRILNTMTGSQSKVRVNKINIHQVTEHVIRLLEAENDSHIVVKNDYDPSIPMLDGDKELLIQAILNIGKNAMQWAGENGQVLFKTHVLHNQILNSKQFKVVACIQIEDTGPGIDEDMQQKLFFPFCGMRKDGTGLGLPIAQSLISQHGGQIETELKPRRTIFKILLPFGHEFEPKPETFINGQ